MSERILSVILILVGYPMRPPPPTQGWLFVLMTAILTNKIQILMHRSKKKHLDLDLHSIPGKTPYRLPLLN